MTKRPETEMRPKTLVVDIDGVLLKHTGDITNQFKCEPEVLPGVLEAIKEWDIKGYRIILLSGRKESMREETKRQLSEAGIIYDQLILGVGGGVRVLVNDRKPNKDFDTAIAVNLERNVGLEGVKI
jgi:ribonucleotide monophosphatase NagD (HAD superfamily)